jgi:hypothetical protein
MKKLLFCIVLLVVFTSSQGQTTLEEKLFALPDVIFKQIDTPEGYEAAYELKIRQEIDHNDPSKGYFYQRAYLSHKGYDNPTAIITNGYGRPSNNITEVAELIDANQINVEHRYFLESSPDSLDYDYLNFEQVTADLHKINQLFRNIYNGKWVSTGISKGGTTTIFYRYFYPDDVDVSIPYVAPVNHSNEDLRIYEFLDNIGSKQCRQDIEAYQMDMLRNSDEMRSLLKWYVKGKDLKFSYLNMDEAYEYAILEFPFSFWQYGHDCALIPKSSDSTEKKLQYFLDIVGLDFYSDSSMESYASHYYQSGTEMGYYGYETEEFKGLLEYISAESHPSAVFMPNKMKANFKGELTNRVSKWAETAPNMIYINGALDTWSATAVPTSDKTNALFFFMEGKHHANARIRNMSENDKKRLIKSLNTWLDIEQP